MVSEVCVVSLAFVVSSVAGLYGTAFALTIIGCEFGPRAFTILPIARPLIGEPSRFFAIGTITQSLSEAGTVRPELSPCHPLLRPMSPSFLCGTEMVTLPPRFGTSCHMRWLDFDRSMGFTRKKLTVYSILPFLFRGASLMSVIIALWASL